jgi:hypothetical protein
MPENLHHDTGAHSLGQHKRSSGVPQVVQPNMAQAGGAHQPLEVPIVIARGQGRAEARRKDQSSQSSTPAASRIGLLLLMPQLQGIDHCIRGRNNPPRSCCLWRHKVEAFARPVLQRLPHS